MPERPKQGEEQTEEVRASSPQLDRLEKLANAAATAAQARQWRARKNGLQDQEDHSEVRNLNHDAEARAQAEAAIRQMMAKPQGKRRQPERPCPGSLIWMLLNPAVRTVNANLLLSVLSTYEPLHKPRQPRREGSLNGAISELQPLSKRLQIREA
jgi:hypothetical protein